MARTWTVGDVSGSTTLTDSDHLYPAHINELRTEVDASSTFIPSVRSYTPSASGTATLDCSDSKIHVIQMPAGNITIALSGISVGQCILVEIIQDAVGSRTVTWFTTIKWAGGSAPTLTTTASKKDTFGLRCTSAGNYDGYIVGQNI